MTHKPTIQVFGDLKDLPAGFTEEFGSDFELIMRSGGARDPIFSFQTEVSCAHAVIALPSAHPFTLMTVIEEAAVQHPFLFNRDGAAPSQRMQKPIVFLGEQKQWQSFHDMFREMKQQGLMRDSFDVVRFLESPREAKEHIENGLPVSLEFDRSEQFYHSRLPNVLFREVRAEDRVKQRDGTIAFYGSASSKTPEHLIRADQAVEMCERIGMNVLHGGGIKSVMGQLSESAHKRDLYVVGVSVDGIGAPGIVGKELGGKIQRPDNVSEYIACKSMIHRIEEYHNRVHANVALDGGIGSTQEILMTATLMSIGHSAVCNRDLHGSLVMKPLHLVNEGGIWSGLEGYLQERKLGHLLEHMQIVPDINRLEIALGDHFRHHPPLPVRSRLDLRENYHASMSPLPNLDTLPSSPYSIEKQREAGELNP